MTNTHNAPNRVGAHNVVSMCIMVGACNTAGTHCMADTHGTVGMRDTTRVGDAASMCYTRPK